MLAKCAARAIARAADRAALHSAAKRPVRHTPSHGRIRRTRRVGRGRYADPAQRTAPNSSSSTTSAHASRVPG